MRRCGLASLFSLRVLTTSAFTADKMVTSEGARDGKGGARRPVEGARRHILARGIKPIKCDRLILPLRLRRRLDTERGAPGACSNAGPAFFGQFRSEYVQGSLLTRWRRWTR